MISPLRPLPLLTCLDVCLRWELPELSVPFFARGCRLLGDNVGGLRSVNLLPSFREGEPIPYLQIDVAVPVSQPGGAYLSHTVLSATTGEVVATWPLQQEGSHESHGQLAYQQVSHASGSRSVVSVGAKSFATQAMQVHI